MGSDFIGVDVATDFNLISDMKKHIEPMWWSLFGAGGAISALFLPVLLFFTGIAFPLGWVETSQVSLKTLVDPWYRRLIILAII